MGGPHKLFPAKIQGAVKKETVERMDKLQQYLQQQNPERAVTRGEVIRMLLEQGLRHYENKQQENRE
jgi:hypothetical protein